MRNKIHIPELLKQSPIQQTLCWDLGTQRRTQAGICCQRVHGQVETTGIDTNNYNTTYKCYR